jgi:hypothetical protein
MEKSKYTPSIRNESLAQIRAMKKDFIAKRATEEGLELAQPLEREVTFYRNSP